MGKKLKRKPTSFAKKGEFVKHKIFALHDEGEGLALRANIKLFHILLILHKKDFIYYLLN